MPKFIWVFIAGLFILDRWGWIGVLAVVGFDTIGYYARGFYEAWKADRKQ